MTLRDLIRGRAEQVAVAVSAVPAALQAMPERQFIDADAGELAAVKLRATFIGDVWLVADDDALAEHPDILRSGLPAFFFDELEQLRWMSPEDLRAIATMKATFPTSRVLQ